MNKHLNTALEVSTSDRIIARMQKDYGLSYDDASAIMQDTIVFLNMVGNNPGCPSSPSPLVDIGWHTFILYTREYTEYCQSICGEYIHHRPNDTPELRAITKPIAATVDFMTSNGIAFNPDLWEVDGPIHSDHKASSETPVTSSADCDNGRGSGCSGWGGPGGCS